MKKRGAFIVHDHDIATQDLTGQTYDFDNYSRNIETAIVASPLIPMPTEDMLPADIGRRVSPRQEQGTGEYILRKGGKDRNVVLYAKYDGQRMKDIYHSRVVCGRVRPHIAVQSGKFARFTEEGPFIKSDTRTPYVIGNKDIIHEWALPRVAYLRQGIFTQDLGLNNFGDNGIAVIDVFCVSSDMSLNTGTTITKNGTEATLKFSEEQMTLPVIIVSARKEGGGNYFAYTSEVTKTHAKIKVRNELGVDMDLTDIVVSATGVLFTSEDFAWQESLPLLIEKDVYEVAVGEVLSEDIKANDVGIQLQIIKINDSEALVDTEWAHPQGGKIKVMHNGQLTFDTTNEPNFADIFGTRTKTIMFTYVAGNHLGQTGDSFVSIKVKAAPITVSFPGPFEVTTRVPKTFHLLTDENNPHGVIKVLNAFSGQALSGGAVTATVPNSNNVNMEITIAEDGTVHYNPIQVDTIIKPDKTLDTSIDVVFTDGNSEFSTTFVIRQKQETGTQIISVTARNDDFGYVFENTSGNVLANDEGEQIEVFKVDNREENVGVFTESTSNMENVPGGKVKIMPNGDIKFDIEYSAMHASPYATVQCTISYSIRMKNNHSVQSTGQISFQYSGSRPRVECNDDNLTVPVSATSVSFNVLENDEGFKHYVYGIPWNTANVGVPQAVTFSPQNIQANVTINRDGTVIFNPSQLAGITENAVGRIQYSASDDNSYGNATLIITVTP